MEKTENKTQYPHIEKPWKRHYTWLTEEDYAEDFPKTSITSYIEGKAMGNENLIAETYYTKKSTFSDVSESRSSASKALTGLGMHLGDKILYMVPNMPSATSLFFAGAEIGINSDYIDPRPDSADLIANSKKVLEIIKREKPNCIIALDRCYLATLKPIENELKNLGINEIVILSAMDDMSLRGKLDYINDLVNYNRLKYKRINSDAARKQNGNFQSEITSSTISIVVDAIKKSRSLESELCSAIKKSPLRVIRYGDLVKDSVFSSVKVSNDPKNVVYTGHTSGTSGSLPKPIELSNANLIAAIEQLFKARVNFAPGEIVLQELPYFAPFGMVDNMILNRASLSNTVVIPEFEITEFGYLIKKYRPNIVVSTPSWAAGIPDYDYLNRKSISGINRIIYGGDSMTRKDEERLQKYLRDNGSNGTINKGHGMSEYGGCGSYAQGRFNSFESIGIPLPNTIYGIVDPDIKDKLVPLGFTDDSQLTLRGELVVSSEAVTSGTMNGETIVKRYELDGRWYIRTNDIVTMDRSGLFYFEERIDRSFTRFDGFKYKPSEVEKVLEQDPYIKKCIITGYFDYNKNGIMPIAHVVLDDSLVYDSLDKASLVGQIIERLINNPTSVSRQIPAKFRFHLSLPDTKNGKTDFKTLESLKLDGTEINVAINETNLEVGDIMVFGEGTKPRTIKRRR